MMLQVNILPIPQQIIPLLVILQQISLMRFDDWHKDLQPTLGIFEQNRLRSKGWQPRQVGGPDLLFGEDAFRHLHHHLDAEEAQATVARCLPGEWLDMAGAPQGGGAHQGGQLHRDRSRRDHL